ncbi:MAG: hypothetical protein V8Q76_14825 [Bacteroides intestinalis]
MFRGTETDGYPLLEEPYYLDFIAVPAINRPELGTETIVDATKNKMRTISALHLPTIMIPSCLELWDVEHSVIHLPTSPEYSTK